ncbi:MAG: CapA family protein [Rikenellaceae bacterium]|jgi:poly-gamma-glutamate synthesis protein (capsule biosynthesis protein)|nr:CapA family protein [Rikenellaceae bacterium]
MALSVLVAGDFCQTGRLFSLIKNREYDSMLSSVKPIIKSADYSIVNFEFPIVSKEKIAKPIPKCGPNLKGTIESVEAIKFAGFNCCTLANNHIMDQGAECAFETKKFLNNSSIDTVGFGNNSEEAGKVLYKEINGESLVIINCCEHEFSIATVSKPGANALNPIKQYYAISEAKAKANYVIVIVHGGHELFHLPSLRMQDTYRFFIDAGADAVVNHHQHCYSGYEVYKDKPIFYGLGNFLFDKYGNRTSVSKLWNEGFMVKLSFTQSKVDYSITPYIQCLTGPYIELLNDTDSRLFFQQLKRLNSIIEDRDQLTNLVNAYYDSSKKIEYRTFEPYRNRVLLKLYSMGLLPRFIKGSKRLSILNRIACESHRDKVIHVFEHKGL